MKKKNILCFEIISFFVISVLGVLFHFLYEWIGGSFIGSFTAINESIWEHLKLLFFPTVLTIIIGSIYLKDYKNYISVKTRGLFLGMAFIVVFYYTYTGIIGNRFAVLDIGSFFVAAFILELYTLKNIYSDKYYNNYLYSYILIITMTLFIIFTFSPPKINLFKDPVNNTYGIK